MKVHRTQEPQLPAKVKQIKGHNSRTEKVSMFEKLILFMVPDLVYKFQMICLRGT